MVAGFAPGGRAVMAAETGTGDVTVIKAGRYPGNRAVTFIAVITALNMIAGFTCRLAPIMTTLA